MLQRVQICVIGNIDVAKKTCRCAKESDICTLFKHLNHAGLGALIGIDSYYQQPDRDYQQPETKDQHLVKQSQGLFT